MGFPKTRAEMVDQSYQRRVGRSVCSGCGSAIEFWRTPKGKEMPMDPMPFPESPATPHWATCPKAESFRKRD